MRVIFKLSGIESASLIISHVSYVVQLVSIKREDLQIELTPQNTQLDEVAITEKPDKQWKRDLKRFRSKFFGDNIWGKACTIENPWVLDFKFEKGTFTALSSDLLKITNKKTGYVITVYLEKFEEKSNQLIIAARPFFESIGSKYELARENTFLGSKRHFFHSLLMGGSKEEGFRLNRVKYDPPTNSFNKLKSLREQDIISNNELKLDGYVEIQYIHENMSGGSEHPIIRICFQSIW
ncbi:MAG: hypothetical protein GY816_14035 [Cytophagales bacterium]|nr:hypothetical protein [Cytophagales bacterium]